ncbi:MAG: alpha/beta hydrolase [Gemmatimonadaceae bacterium]|nr:alpha/beta hydrolase [Gemmatimonadaceae bacterium]
MRNAALTALATTVLNMTAMSGASAQRPAAPAASYPRDTITARLAELRRIHTPNGIETLEPLEINGSRQWISIRGLDRNNPVLFVLHGGPGSSLMGMSWAYQRPWEDYFTVVNWDQRGSGKSFSAADSARLGPTMTEQQLADDAAAVMAHVRKTLGARKMVVLAFSHGTIFGPLLVNQHAEWVSAYVTIGEGSAENEREMFRNLFELATAKGDTATLRQLNAMRPYPPVGREPTTRELLAMRAIVQRYGGAWYGKTDLSLYSRMWDWAPEFSLDEVANISPAVAWTNRHLIDGQGGHKGASETDYRVPVIMLHGRHDLMDTYSGAKAYFDRIRAPKKEFITFEHSAHFLMFEEPGRLLVTLVQKVLPLATGR